MRANKRGKKRKNMEILLRVGSMLQLTCGRLRRRGSEHASSLTLYFTRSKKDFVLQLKIKASLLITSRLSTVNSGRHVDLPKTQM